MSLQHLLSTSPRNELVYGSSSFQSDDSAAVESLIKAFPLATVIAIDQSAQIFAATVPLVVDAGEAKAGRFALVGHFARANPHWKRCATARDVLVVFHGADTYITPSYYPEKREHGRVVPTWNYRTVHIRGKFELVASESIQSDGQGPAVARVLEQLTDAQESGRAKPWRVNDAPEAFITAHRKGVIAFRIVVESVAAVFKNSQNKSTTTALVTGLRADAAVGGVAASVKTAKMMASADDLEAVAPRSSKL